MWKITHDLLAEPGDEINHVGKGIGVTIPCPATLTFRLLDDDMEHYYTGRADDAAYLDDEARGSLVQCWEWAMRDSGCTHLAIKLDDAVRLGMSPEIAEQISFKTGPHKGWVSLYA